MTPVRVTLVGGGLIGSSWATIFARAGCPVRLFDVSPEQRAVLPGTIDTLTGNLAAAGLIDDKAAVLERIEVVEQLDAAVDRAAAPG